MKIVTQDGSLVHDFKRDDLGKSLLWRLCIAGKFQEFLDPLITLNHETARLQQSLAGPDFDGIPVGADDHAAHKIKLQLQNLLFEQAPQNRWWDMSASTKSEWVDRTYFPFLLTDEQRADVIQQIDFRVSRYRDENKAPDQPVDLDR